MNATRRPLVAGNWKLNKGPKAAVALALALHERLANVSTVDMAVFPTALSVAGVCKALDRSALDVGVQMVHGASNGAHTGHNSALMARELGCTWVLVGHSEVRSDLGQSLPALHNSLVAALDAGLLPMLCIGETLEERQAGKLEDVLRTQLETAFGDLPADRVSVCELAYEPVWAIGTGETASPAQAQAAHAFIRAWLRDTYPAFVADNMRLLYGGSVKPANAAELFSQPDIDGGLIGGAALKPDDFAAIVAAASA